MTRKQPFDSWNAGYVQALYEDFSRNPQSVPETWREFFSRGSQAAIEAGLMLPDALAEAAPAPSPSPPTPDGIAPPAVKTPPGEAATHPAAAESVQRLLPVVARAAAFVQAFRAHGHQLARLDPLGSEPPGHPQLDPSFFGTSMDELEALPASVVSEAWQGESLAETLHRLERAYCGSAGYEFEHLEDPDKVRWLWNQVESGAHTAPLSNEVKEQLLVRLSDAEGLETFLHRSYLGQKRFSLEGSDMLIPLLDEAVALAAVNGAREIFIGMAHRGRLNVLAHTVGVDAEDILRGFEDRTAHGSGLSIPARGTGDVKYHLGADGERTLPDGSKITVTMAPNPSHLEFVNPVVEGMTRARQFEDGMRDTVQDMAAVVPILLHGDAAFAAEGVVAETLNLARLEGYRTGGTVHVIVNNQMGFTTEPSEARSTRYSSDLAKGYDIPIIHVNGDDPEACLGAIRLAMAYRAHFHDDVVIDLIGYRRHGHNEGDEPAYTQPLLYSRISAHPTTRTLWARRLVEDGVISEERVKEIQNTVTDRLRRAQEEIQGEPKKPTELDREPPEPEPMCKGEEMTSLEDLVEVNEAALSWPESFLPHPKLARQLDRRRADFGADFTLEWAHAETLALGTLLREGVAIRISGQDSERGTFSQRHLVLHDVETGGEVIPLAGIGNARFEVHNSPLSETAVLGFEYGYQVATENQMVLWEAQFGDFVNVAQVIIDQFIAAGLTKWGQSARLVMLLPHGFEGQGPEHSSARLERFLQLCAEDNMRVAYPSTPAQYFCLLRRQALGTPERPLVVMTPKSLLRHPRATSKVQDLIGACFQTVMDDPMTAERRDEVESLVLCSGKFYYDIIGSPLREEARDTAVARIEQLHPFPTELLTQLVESYPHLKEVVWSQEEPRNMGALSYIGPRLRAVIPRKIPLRHVARPERASPAEGKASDHVSEQNRLVEESLSSAAAQ